MTTNWERLGAAQVAPRLEAIGKALQASFVLVSLLEGDTLVFPYLWGDVPDDVQRIVQMGQVALEDSSLARTLVETGSAYYSEQPYNEEGETLLKALSHLLGVEPLKTSDGHLLGFVNVGREASHGTWTSEEQTTLRQLATELAAEMSRRVVQNEPVMEQRLKGLLHLSSSLSKALTPNEVYETVLAQSMNVLGIRAGAVTILRPDDTLEIIAAQGQPKAVIAAQQRISLEANHPLADTVREGKAFYFSDIEERNTRYAHLLHLFSSATQSSAFVPMLSQGKAIGVLTLSFPEHHAFEADEREFIEALADVCARALERSLAFEREHSAKENYQTIFHAIDDGFCIFEMLYDDEGQPYDYRFLEVNPKFEAHTGLKEAVGKTAKELVPNLEQHWVDTYAKVALTGEPLHFEQGSAVMGRWFEVSGVRVGGEDSRKVALIFKDVSARKRQEETLRQSAAHLQLTLDASLAGTWSWDIGQNTAIWDDRFRSLYGFDEGEAGNLETWTDRIHPEDRAQLQERMRTMFDTPGDDHWNKEFRIVHTNGDERWMLGLGQIERDPDGKAVRFAGINLDITERKRRELNLAFLAELEQSLALLSAASNVMEVAASRIAAHLKLSHCLFVEISEAADEARVLYDHHAQGERSLLGTYKLADFHPEDRRQKFTTGQAFVVSDVRGELTSFQADNYEALGIRSLLDTPYVSDGRWKFVLSAMHEQPYRWREAEQDMLAELAARLWTRLERVRSEEKLRASEERLKLGIEVANFALANIDYFDNTITLSKETAVLYGLGETEVTLPRESVHATFHPDDKAWLAKGIAEVLDPRGTGEMVCEHRVVLPSGETRWLSVRKRIFFNREAAKPHPTWGLLAAQDITERKRDEERLRLLESVVVNTSDTVMITEAEPFDEPGPRIVYVNQSFTDLTGYNSEEAVGRSPRMLQGPKTDRQQLRKIRAALEARQPARVEITNYRKDGSDFEVEFEIVPVADRTGLVTHWVSVQRDITERKLAEEKVRTSEARFRRILKQSQAGIVETDATGRMTLVNERWCKMLGYTEAELLGMNVLDVTHPTSLEATREAVGRLAAGGPDFQIEKNYRRKDGSLMVANSSVSALRSPDGTFVGLVAVVLDITERRRAEDALREADRRKDEFLAVLAHELRNPLAPIRMSLEIMKRSDDKTMHQETRAIIERQTDQIVRLVDDLLDVSRITRGTINLHKESLTLTEVMNMALEAAKPLMAEKNHQLLLGLPVRGIPLEGDKTRLCQVFLNLLTNAAKYSNPGSKVSVSGELEGREVVVRVQDTGIGLAPETLHKVFDLFARVNAGEAAKQEGLGIGLHLVKRLVDMHGGSIAVSSPGLGQGSTFTVRLPVLVNDLQAIPVPVTETKAKPANASRRVLMVDDYEANRKTLTRMLKLMGHEVTGAGNGQEALELLQDFTPDLILLDINMPGMSGYETAKRIKENPEHATIKLVALTGYGADDDLRKAKEAGFHHHLVKPVDMKVLEELLGNSTTN